MNPEIRDIESDYIRAYEDEYKRLLAIGNQECADRVAEELKKLGHDVKPHKAPPKKAVKERAVAADDTEKAVEQE